MVWVYWYAICMCVFLLGTWCKWCMCVVCEWMCGCAMCAYVCRGCIMCIISVCGRYMWYVCVYLCSMFVGYLCVCGCACICTCVYVYVWYVCVYKCEPRTEANLHVTPHFLPCFIRGLCSSLPCTLKPAGLWAFGDSPASTSYLTTGAKGLQFHQSGFMI